MAELFDWQQPLADRLRQMWDQHLRVVNAMPTGTGKTYLAGQVLQGRNRPPLVICPKSVISSWRRVLSEFSVSPLAVLNWEQLKTNKHPWWNRSQWWLPENCDVVVDEAHQGCSGPQSQITKMTALLKAYRVPVLLQSATLADSPLKLRAAGYLLDLHGYVRNDYYSWCMRNGCYKSMWHNGLEFPKGPKGRRFMAALHATVKDRLLTCSVEDIPGFPECQIEAELYDLGDHYKQQVDQIYAEMEDRLRNTHGNEMVEVQHARERVELYKIPLLHEIVPPLVEEGKSVVIFVNFRPTCERLYEWAQQVFGKAAIIIGGQDSGESTEVRDANVGLFQRNEAPVCVCMSQAGGLGLSLHDERHERPRISLLFPNWSATITRQCLGRIRRAGGTPVVQRFVLAAGTVEERVYRSVLNKASNIDALNDGDLM